MPYGEESVAESEHPEPRTGVQHIEVSPDEAGQRLDNYLQRHLSGIPKSRLYRVIRKGEVRVNGKRAGPETRLNAADRVRVPPPRLSPAPDPGRPSPDLVARISSAIVHEDPR